MLDSLHGGPQISVGHQGNVWRIARRLISSAVGPHREELSRAQGGDDPASGILTWWQLAFGVGSAYFERSSLVQMRCPVRSPQTVTQSVQIR